MSREPRVGRNPVQLDLKLERRSGSSWKTLDATTLSLRVRTARPGSQTNVPQRDRRQRAVLCPRPALAESDGAKHDSKKPGLVLTLHGAAVEAIGQAEAYAPKPGLHIVAPTNRRPYGFDWEDWGRLDALEVLDLAQRTLQTDPRRTYLTGHSMGGHGTWHLGVTFPDRFAAIAPSAGWISMMSYAGVRKTD